MVLISFGNPPNNKLRYSLEKWALHINSGGFPNEIKIKYLITWCYHNLILYENMITTNNEISNFGFNFHRKSTYRHKFVK